MSERKDFSAGLGAKLCGAFADFGGTPEEVNLFSENEQMVRGALAVLRGTSEIKPVVKWTLEDGTIRFTVTSNGFSGKDWIKHFDKKGVKIGDYAKQLLLSKSFKPTKKGTVHNIAVIKGEFFSDDNRITSKIREEAEGRKMTKPNPEVACLIRDKFTDKEIKEMGLLWVVAMHEPIKDSDGVLYLLSAHANVSKPWLNAYYGYPDSRWLRESGFAFVALQVGSKN